MAARTDVRGPTYVFSNMLYVEGLPLLDTVDIAIIPDLYWAARLGWAETLWGEEVVIRDVPLDWSMVPADLRPEPPVERGDGTVSIEAPPSGGEGDDRAGSEGGGG